MQSTRTPATRPRLRSRRRPALRVVGGELPPRRANVFRIHNVEYVVEVLTFEEFDALPLALRPDPKTLHFLPGCGWAVLRLPITRDEVADLIDVARQAQEERALYGRS